MAGPEPGRGRETLYGVHPVWEALRAGRRQLHTLWVRRGRQGAGARRAQHKAGSLGVAVEVLDPADFGKKVPSGANDQGIALEAGPLPLEPLESLLAREEAPRLFLALDEVEDPRNVGAIARVADAAGALGLVLTERRSPPLSPAVARASAGAIESLPVSRVANLPRALDRMREAGVWVFGADLESGEDLFGLPDRVFQGDACVVLGAEGRGLRPGVQRRVDHPVRLPMRGRVESLNVASAAAVILYEWARRARA